MRDTVAIRWSERTTVDSERLSELADEMGVPAAERFLGRSIEEIANWTTLAWAAYHTADTRGLVRAAREIRASAHSIGLCSLARVARDVASAAASGDATATGATLARLSRLSDSVQFAIGETWTASH